MANLLRISGLTVGYRTSRGMVRALDDVDLELGSEEFLAVVGESGCGKTTLGLSIIGLLPPRSAKVTSGSIDYKGVDLAKLDPNEMRRYRGSEVAMIFQEPLTSLNPLVRVGDQIAEAIVLRRQRKGSDQRTVGEVMQRLYRTDKSGFSRWPRLRSKIPRDLRDQVIEWLNLVRIPDPGQVIERYPFELSGGMRQRVMIAMALSQEPALLVADEPTTALDVTTQAQVLRLMKEIKDKLGTSILLVTHDLAVASQVADRAIVMYAGRIAEDSNIYDLFSSPLHPYTQGLLSCMPTGTKEGSNLKPIPGSIPDLTLEAVGCRFQPRCPRAMDVCLQKDPTLMNVKEGHKAACFLYER
ncbi:MAG: ABC transporter ATP-binding protein [Thaumarchaeota archaeon]|nr:ABC transporter ATP-binding protein [Nitrososphaerota archaeon]